MTATEQMVSESERRRKMKEKPTRSIELGALVEDTSTIGTRAGTDQVGEETTSKAGVDVGSVTGVGGLVAAGQLGLVTALGLGLLDGHAVGDVPADGIAVLGAETVLAAGESVLVGSGSSQGRDGEDNGGQRELHVDGVVVEERVGTLREW